MTFDASQYKRTKQQQWDAIQSARGQFEGDTRFVGPCELVAAGAAR